eukprot:228658-Pleurochrysis_carterae.AAC.2
MGGRRGEARPRARHLRRLQPLARVRARDRVRVHVVLALSAGDRRRGGVLLRSRRGVCAAHAGGTIRRARRQGACGRVL